MRRWLLCTTWLLGACQAAGAAPPHATPSQAQAPQAQTSQADSAARLAAGMPVLAHASFAHASFAHASFAQTSLAQAGFGQAGFGQMDLAEGALAGSTLAGAVRAGDILALRAALRDGADPDGRDPDGHTPLMVAAAHGDPFAVELLLAAGADVHRLEPQTGTGALHKAALGGNPRVVELLLGAGAFINQQSPLNGHTPLIDAVWYRQPASVRALLEAGARIDVPAHLHGTVPPQTALDYARAEVEADRAAGASGGQAEMILGLLEDAAAARAAQTPLGDLLAAIADDDLARATALLDAGADPNGRALNGYTPIIFAAQEGRASMVRLLLDRGATPSQTGLVMPATPVHKAAYGGHAEVVAMLLEAGGPLEAQGPNNGYTALIVPCGGAPATARCPPCWRRAHGKTHAAMTAFPRSTRPGGSACPTAKPRFRANRDPLQHVSKAFFL